MKIFATTVSLFIFIALVTAPTTPAKNDEKNLVAAKVDENLKLLEFPSLAEMEKEMQNRPMEIRDVLQVFSNIYRATRTGKEVAVTLAESTGDVIIQKAKESARLTAWAAAALSAALTSLPGATIAAAKGMVNIVGVAGDTILHLPVDIFEVIKAADTKKDIFGTALTLEKVDLQSRQEFESLFMACAGQAMVAAKKEQVSDVLDGCFSCGYVDYVKDTAAKVVLWPLVRGAVKTCGDIAQCFDDGIQQTKPNFQGMISPTTKTLYAENFKEKSGELLQSLQCIKERERIAAKEDKTRQELKAKFLELKHKFEELNFSFMKVIQKFKPDWILCLWKHQDVSVREFICRKDGNVRKEFAACIDKTSLRGVKGCTENAYGTNNDGKTKREAAVKHFQDSIKPDESLGNKPKQSLIETFKQLAPKDATAIDKFGKCIQKLTKTELDHCIDLDVVWETSKQQEFQKCFNDAAKKAIDIAGLQKSFKQCASTVLKGEASGTAETIRCADELLGV